MKKKLRLNELKVESFITALTTDVKGGADLSQIDCRSGLLSPCLTGVYPTIPVDGCANTGTNHRNCPCDDVTRIVCTNIASTSPTC